MANRREVDLRTRDKRSINITIRVSEAERDAITDAAAAAEVPVTDFIREAIRCAVLEELADARG